MSPRPWFLLLAVALVIAVAAGSSWWAAAQDGEQPEAPAIEEPATEQQPPVANPVVAVVPYRSETEYQPDPFEPDRLRRSETEVKELILIRADGSIEHKRAW